MLGNDLFVLTVKFISVYWILLATQPSQITLFKVHGFMFSLTTKKKYIEGKYEEVLLNIFMLTL